MNNNNDLNTSEERSALSYQNEIRALKRKLALAEQNLLRTQNTFAAMERVESIVSDSIKKELEFFKLVLNNTTNILLLFDVDGRFAYASRTFLREANIAAFGLIHGRHFWDVFRSIIDYKSRTTLSEAINNAIEKKATVSLELQMDFADKGEPRIFSILITPMFDDDSIITGIMVLFNDITEIRTTIAQIREADERTQIMLDAMPLCANFWNRDMQNMDCNLAAVQFFGLSSKQEYFDRFGELSPEYQPCGTLSGEMGVASVTKAFQDGYSRMEWMHQSLDGEPIPCEVIHVRVKYKDDYIVAGYTRDLRELKAMLSEIRRIEVAEESSKAKSRFLATMSHEIRTPINAILGIAQIQLQKNELPDEHASALEKIYNSGNDLLAIINDILDMSKIETGKLELTPAEYDMASLINDAVQLNIVRIGSKQIKFELVIDDNLPSRLKGDSLRIKQILNNLLTNAIKYTEVGRVRLNVGFSAQGDEVTLRFIVEDTGIGIKAEDQERLFSEYSRFSTGMQVSTEGSGLGLSIAKRLVEMMDGEITAESEYGKGSIFTVELKQTSVGSGTIGSDVASQLRNFTYSNVRRRDRREVVREIMPYGKILIVDDVSTNLYVSKGLLSPYMLDIDTATSGFETIEKVLRGSVYDVIFMDHMMPQMDGIMTTTKLRALGYKEPIVALTANALVGNEEFFVQHGFDGFVSKPIDIRALDAVLNKFVRDRHPEKAKKYKRVKPMAAAMETRTMETQKITPKLSTELIKVFKRDAVETVTTLDNAARNADMKELASAAHSIKPGLSAIGEKEAYMAAIALENAANKNDKEFVFANTKLFIEKLNSIIANLPQNEADAADDGNNTDDAKDKAELEELLLLVKIACENYDAAAAYAEFDRAAEMALSSKSSALLNELREMLYLDSDFDKAVNTIKDLLE